MWKAWRHFCTITKHRHLVMKHCFRVGLYRQGLLHDLSKYGWTEFHIGAKYYQGDRSPNAAEREEYGYSTAWMHHKGRNKHHFEYWTDFDPVKKDYAPVEMPTRYLVEMVMDRMAACKVYEGENYTDGSPLAYLQRAHDNRLMHPRTQAKLVFLLSMLRDEGEERTFRYIRQVVLKGKNFGPEVPEDAEARPAHMA